MHDTRKQMVKVELKDQKTKSESKCKTYNTLVGQQQHNIQTTIVRIVKVSLLSFLHSISTFPLVFCFSLCFFLVWHIFLSHMSFKFLNTYNNVLCLLFYTHTDIDFFLLYFSSRNRRFCGGKMCSNE